MACGDVPVPVVDGRVMVEYRFKVGDRVTLTEGAMMSQTHRVRHGTILRISGPRMGRPSKAFVKLDGRDPAWFEMFLFEAPADAEKPAST